MSKKILIPIAYGTEDMEAVICIDLFRRAEYYVTAASTNELVTLSRGIQIRNLNLIENITPETEFDAIVIPGGLNGVNILKNETILLELIRNNYEKGNLIAAICAAPLVVKVASILSNTTNLTSHPSVASEFGDNIYLNENVVISDNLITSRGAGTTFDFAFAIMNYFGDKELAQNISKSILYS